MLIANFENIKLEPFEYCFLMGDTNYTASEFPVKIPKLLPLANSMSSSTVAINNNIFINDAACKPQTSNTITVRNYLMLKKFRNVADFRYKVPNIEVSSIIPKGTKFIASIINENIKDIYLTDNI